MSLDTTKLDTTIKSEHSKETLLTPIVFHYLDFKKFLADFYNFKKKSRKGYSFGQFALKANLQTRNYLKRVISGERPLSPNFIPGFCIALDLNYNESLYFENLVNFNQAKDDLGKKHYFEQLKAAKPKDHSSALQIVENQFDVFSDWYFLPIFELTEVMSLGSDPRKIAKRLKNKVTPQQVKEAIEVLLRVGLLSKDAGGVIRKTKNKIEYNRDVINFAIRKYHSSMLDLAKHMIAEENLEDRHMRALSLAIPKEDWAVVKKTIDQFYKDLNEKYSSKLEVKNEVIQINTQILKLSKEI